MSVPQLRFQLRKQPACRAALEYFDRVGYSRLRLAGNRQADVVGHDLRGRNPELCSSARDAGMVLTSVSMPSFQIGLWYLVHQTIWYCKEYINPLPYAKYELLISNDMQNANFHIITNHYARTIP